jgi:GcrA cell cycle regulator
MNPAAGPGWTDERIELLKKLWHGGLSASQIAKELGEVSRNAVLSKIHRLGAAERGRPAPPSRRPPAPPRAPKPPAAARPLNNIAMTPAVAPEFPLRAALPAPTPTPANEDAFAPLPKTQPRPLMDRPHKGCTWPVGEDTEGQMLVCCEPADGRWCPTHNEINRRKAPKASSTNDLARGLRRYV